MRSVIIGIGTDLAEVPRIRRSIENYGDRFLAPDLYRAGADVLIAKGECGRTVRGTLRGQGSGHEGDRDRPAARDHLEGLRGGERTSGRPTLRLSGVAKQIAERLGVAADLTVIDTYGGDGLCGCDLGGREVGNKRYRRRLNPAAELMAAGPLVLHGAGGGFQGCLFGGEGAAFGEVELCRCRASG